MKKKIQKPFNVEAAKNGAKVETKSGHPVRILCYDRLGPDYPIVALVNYNTSEMCYYYTIDGKFCKSDYDTKDLVIVEEVENLWTLEDAKPGNILVSTDDCRPFIFKGFYYAGVPTAYCGINTRDSITVSASDNAWTHSPVRPATYEERLQLFNKLEEEGYKWDADSLTLFKKRWRDNEYKTISGYYTHANSRITYSQGHSNIKENYNIFATEKQAKSALAMARISQIMANDERFGGAITDEEWNTDKKYIIIRRGNNLGIETRYCYEYLAFHTNEQAELFLEENEDLVKDYYMMD